MPNRAPLILFTHLLKRGLGFSFHDAQPARPRPVCPLRTLHWSFGSLKKKSEKFRLFFYGIVTGYLGLPKLAHIGKHFETPVGCFRAAWIEKTAGRRVDW